MNASLHSMCCARLTLMRQTFCLLHSARDKHRLHARTWCLFLEPLRQLYVCTTIRFRAPEADRIPIICIGFTTCKHSCMIIVYYCWRWHSRSSHERYDPIFKLLSCVGGGQINAVVNHMLFMRTARPLTYATPGHTTSSFL